MPPLSVVIITYNEEKNIARCLDSVKDIADDIVVVDSFSTDTTEAICKKYPLQFIQCKWEGYSATKNFANSKAKYDRILSLDADEALSEELKRSILEAKKKDVHPAYEFNRLTNYCGKWIRHCGWYPDKKLRIFDRRNAKWEGSIHEQLVLKEHEPVLFLKGDCLHYSYDSIEGHKKQTERFTDLAAQAMFAEGKHPGLFKRIFGAPVKFIGDYIFRLGFLDGYYGYVVCRISAKATAMKYSKLQKLYDQKVK